MDCTAHLRRCHKIANLQFVAKTLDTQEIDDINLPTECTRCCGDSNTKKRSANKKSVFSFILAEKFVIDRYWQAKLFNVRTGQRNRKKKCRMSTGTTRRNTYMTHANLALSITVCFSLLSVSIYCRCSCGSLSHFVAQRDSIKYSLTHRSVSEWANK